VPNRVIHAHDLYNQPSMRNGKQLDVDLRPAFDTLLVSPDGAPAQTFSGTSIAVDGALGATDIVILPAFWGNFDELCRKYAQVLPWLRQCHAQGSAICGEATGAFWMAAAGLLDDKEATTHWRSEEHTSE